jgi:hypothetical protein
MTKGISFIPLMLGSILPERGWQYFKKYETLQDECFISKIISINQSKV